MTHHYKNRTSGTYKPALFSLFLNAPNLLTAENSFRPPPIKNPILGKEFTVLLVNTEKNPPKRKSMKLARQIRQFSSFCLIFGLGATCTAQMRNYSPSGIIKSSDERIEIKIHTAKKVRSGGPPVSFPSVIGDVITLGVGVIKNILSSEEAKYTASYTATTSGRSLFVVPAPFEGKTADLNIDSIQIIRTLVFSDLTTKVANEIVIVPDVDPFTGLFRFKLQRLNMAASKAKLKNRGEDGKLLELNIDIKIDVLYPETIKSTKSDSSEGRSRTNSSTLADTSYSFKSATLGESSIFISGIKPEGAIVINGDHYTSWFQPIPGTSLKFGTASNKGAIGNYQLTVVVKEANPYGIKAKQLSDFFNSSNSDINTIVKQIFPVPTK